MTEFHLSPSYEELVRNDGEPIEFEWNIFPGRTSLQIFPRVQCDLRRRNNEPEGGGDRIIFMSLFSDFDWTAKGNEGKCISNSDPVKMYANIFSQGHLDVLWVLETQRSSMETLITILKENGIPLLRR